MDFVTGKDLGLSLRNSCNSVRRRLWIASPYVGGWNSVRRLLGRHWLDSTKCEVRLLTDLEEGGLNGTTMQRLAQRGPVHTLRGLHAKLNIIDDTVLLTSAKRGVESITKSKIIKVVEGLNCMNDTRQRNRFLNSPKNSTIAIRKAWADLLYGTQPDSERMSLSASRLFSFKRSSVQEWVGFFAPADYPLRNATVNAGPRFFGFDVTAG